MSFQAERKISVDIEISRRPEGAPRNDRARVMRVNLLLALGPVDRIRADVFPITPASLIADILLRACDSVLHRNWIAVRNQRIPIAFSVPASARPQQARWIRLIGRAVTDRLIQSIGRVDRHPDAGVRHGIQPHIHVETASANFIPHTSTSTESAPGVAG